MPLAERAAELLKARKQTIALCESSTGGLISAALLAVPGASAYYIGSVVVYTRQAWDAVRDFREAELGGVRAATEHNALVRARIARERFATVWGVGETGAADPRWQWTTSGAGTGRFSFGDAHAAVFTGFPGPAIALGPVTLEKLDSPFATLIIVPANPAQTIAQADKLLICAIGRCDNVGLQWDAQRKTTGFRWGTGAARIEPVKATLKLAATGTYTLRSLDVSGQPQGDGTPVPTAGGSATITLPGDSPWYVVERR